MTVSSTSRTIRARFSGNECLYTDHNGMRVVADIEGSGRFEIKGEVEIHIDGEKGVEAVFTEHLLVLAHHGVECEVLALLGPDPGKGRSVKVSDTVEGCGWVTASGAPLEIDSNRVLVEPPSPHFPIPYFQSVKSDGEFRVCRDKGATTRVTDCFDTSDLAALKQRDWKVQNGSDLFDLKSLFSDGSEHEAMHMSHLNTASWTVKIPRENDGLVLRKLYDRFHGRQRARVLVDGRHAGWWYEPEQDRSARWAWATFGVPKELTHGKSEVRLSIDPPAGVPLWDVSRLEILAILQL